MPQNEQAVETIHISFGIKSEILKPEEISAALEIQPSRAFAKGERYLSKTRDLDTGKIITAWYEHPWGIWAIETKSSSEITKVEYHANYLLDILEPTQDRLLRYLQDEHYTISFSIWWETAINAGGFSLTPKTIQRMSLLCHRLDFSFVYMPPLLE